jgi:hypothetical protein
MVDKKLYEQSEVNQRYKAGNSTINCRAKRIFNRNGKRFSPI